MHACKHLFYDRLNLTISDPARYNAVRDRYYYGLSLQTCNRFMAPLRSICPCCAVCMSAATCFSLHALLPIRASICNCGMAPLSLKSPEKKAGSNRARCESMQQVGRSDNFRATSRHQHRSAYRRERISSGALSWIGNEACCSRLLGPIGCPSCNITHFSFKP